MTASPSRIPVAKPWLGAAEAEATSRVILSGWVTQGPEVAAFEEEFAAFVGAPHACAVSNCTAALQLALRAVGAGPGTEVVTVSHSFIATANAVRLCGATPVFVDVQPDTFNMDPACIPEVLTPRTRAILCVHQLGMPCDMEAILAVARNHHLPVIEDAACAVGSRIFRENAWQPIGAPAGDIACFSFHPRKLLTTGDGGMLTTRNPEWDRLFRLWRQHGMTVSDSARHGSNVVVFESYADVGGNFRLTDIQAAVGRVQLRRLPEMVARRREQAARYHELLGSIAGVRVPAEPAWARSNWQSYCVRLASGADQQAVMQSMLDAGIATRRGVMCAHREPAFLRSPWTCPTGASEACECPPGSCRRLRESEKAQDQCMLLPLFHEMTQAEQKRVVRALAEALAHAVRLGAADAAGRRGQDGSL